MIHLLTSGNVSTALVGPHCLGRISTRILSDLGTGRRLIMALRSNSGSNKFKRHVTSCCNASRVGIVINNVEGNLCSECSIRRLLSSGHLLSRRVIRSVLLIVGSWLLVVD